MFKILKREFKEVFGFYKEMDNVPGYFGLLSAAGLFFGIAIVFALIEIYVKRIPQRELIFLIFYVISFFVFYIPLKTSTSKKNIFRKSFFALSILFLIFLIITYFIKAFI